MTPERDPRTLSEQRLDELWHQGDFNSEVSDHIDALTEALDAERARVERLRSGLREIAESYSTDELAWALAADALEESDE